MTQPVHILGIETSCDETAAAVVTNGHEINASVVASQTDLHERYGGVVPEIASRAHIERIYPVVQDTLTQADMALDDITAITVANEPGLSIALIVGLTAAKTLAFMTQKPLIAVNHVHAHFQSALIDDPRLEMPAIALIVSGGHTNIYTAQSPLGLTRIGRTVDDAAGEAFDKVAAILGLPYPGGPSIEKCAKNGDPSAIKFPRSMLDKDNFDFSFSGLKTAVLYHCQGQDMKTPSQVGNMTPQQIADIAASFQAAAVEILTEKTRRAARANRARTVLLGGGVAANTALREAMNQMCENENMNLRVAPKKLCTDNAVMIASLAYYKYKAGLFADMSLEASATARE